MAKKFVLHCMGILLFLMPAFKGLTQGGLKIGQWQQHLPYTISKYVAQSSNKVYFSSDWALMALDKENYQESPSFITTIEGLSNTAPEVISFNSLNEALLVSYSDGSFDVVDSEGVRTYNNIRDDANFFNRTINSISMAKDSMAYFATAFGIVEFNVSAEEFGVTVDMGMPVFEVAVLDGFIYATTEDGIFQAVDDPRINLKDLTNWQRLGPESGFPATYICNAIGVYNQKLYLEIDDNLMVWENDLLRLVYEATNDRSLEFISTEGEHMLAGFHCPENNCNGEILIIDEQEQIQKDVQSCVNRLQYAIEDQQGRIWHADLWRGFRVSNPSAGTCDVLRYKTPFAALISDVLVENDKVYLAASLELQSVGTAILDQGEWKIYNNTTRNELEGAFTWGHYKVAVHPETGNAFVATFFRGLMEIDLEDNITFYTDDFQMSDDPNAYRIGGLAFDENNNLWMSNHTANNPVIVRRADGTFKNDFIGVPAGVPMHHVVIDRNGYKWYSIDENGLFVFDEGDIDDPTDDRSKFITSGRSELPNDEVLSLAVDLDGDVWVGTADGAVVFECDPFNENNICVGRKPIVEVEGIAAFLLEGESVLSIMVDGANRKWFGTSNGIFVQSPDGREQVANYNIENAPLFDNTILAMDFNPENGEVFVGTGRGLMSFRSDATGGGIVNSSDIYAFPNPVRPEYEGPIAIKGLVRDANVKITDINGQLVFETRALGGQAIWDGRDFNGRKASSGVYLVYSTNTQNRQNTDAVVTKILLLK
jgi:hypothetical protein